MIKDIVATVRPALVMTALFALLLGLAYPAAIGLVAQTAFPWQANGSLVEQNGRVIGSDLIGQAFSSDRYFHGRPSAAGAGYDATASSGSNLGPASAALSARVRDAVASPPISPGVSVPPDLVTTSASGLDPHISPEAALFQVDRVAQARKLDAEQVRAVVQAQVEPPVMGILGETRVNVLRLNRALDGMPAKGAVSAP